MTGYRLLLLVACTFSMIGECLMAETAESSRPNVVLFLIDDFGWSDLGCYGSKYYHSPNVDRLAAEGMRFTQAYAACPVCSPTRASIMTGKYPARLHLTDWLPGRGDLPGHKLLRPRFRQELPLEEITIAELLHDAGYATGMVGKWHLGGAGFEPTHQGFDSNLAGDQAGSPSSYFAPYIRAGRTMPGLDDSPPGEYLTDRLAAEAEKFIDAHQSGPFFLYLPHYAVHTPLKAKPELIAKYESAPKAGLQQNPIYAAMVDSMDQAVGRVLKKLESLKLADNTLVIFTSDNGGLATTEGPDTPATNNAPLREGKGYLYEGGIRVPLIVRWPGKIKPGTTCDTAVCSIDYLPTIADCANVPLNHTVDGTSLRPLLTQTGPLPERPLFWHYPHYSNQGGRPGAAMREGDFKLIEFFENGRRELFNVVKDASETMNLVEQQCERAEQMAAKLHAWQSAVDAQEMSPNPNYTPDTQAADGSVTLAARTAEVHGPMIRFEPLPHKNTIGFWVRPDDWVSWQFDLNSPGKFEVEILQGCGPGSGGSQVEFAVDDPSVTTTVEETGGFQNFKARQIGTLTVDKPGRHTLSVKARSKPGAAVMDLRQVRLVPATP